MRRRLGARALDARPSIAGAEPAVVIPVSEAERGPITVAIMIAMVMVAIDQTIALISLPHMQGSLSASPEQITWVVTSYIVTMAVATPLSSWLADRLGAKTLLLFSIASFTVASMFCGTSTSLSQAVLARVLQGLASAPIPPLAQAVLMNINPPHRQGGVMAAMSVGSIVAPALGPVLGGWLTEQLSWRWCFYINLGPGILALLLLWAFLPRIEGKFRRFDFLGFSSLALAVGAFQLMMDRGPSLDWFGSREIWVELVVSLSCFWIYIAHSLTARHPLFDPAVARDRNFVTMTLLGFSLNILWFGSISLLPLLLQNVMGYPVLLAGLITMPRGLVMLAMTYIMVRVDGHVDRRLLVAAGICACVWAFWQMAHFDLAMTSRPVVLAAMTASFGQGVMSIAMMTLTFATISPALRGDAATVLNVFRTFGGSIGVSLMQAVIANNSQSMHASLAGHVVAAEPVVRAGLPPWLSPDSVQGALALNAEISRQATMVAYLDCFRLLIVLGLLTLPLLFLLRQPRGRGAVLGRVEAGEIA